MCQALRPLRVLDLAAKLVWEDRTCGRIGCTNFTPKSPYILPVTFPWLWQVLLLPLLCLVNVLRCVCCKGSISVHCKHTRKAPCRKARRWLAWLQQLPRHNTC